MSLTKLPILTALLIPGSYTPIFAGGTFQFISRSTINTEEPSILAILELSGSSPYDHTAISSLIFTPLAEEALGYLGPYEGDLETTIGTNRVIENADNILGATSVDPTNLGALFRDMDPPLPVDPIVVPVSPTIDITQISALPPARLTLQFFNTDNPFSYITNGLDSRSALGQWVRVIPEPSSLSIAVLMVIVFLAQIGRNRSQVNI